MPIYDPLTNVMPLASMVTNAVVGASLGDQIRDNLVALYDGWWFRASKSATTTMAGSVSTPFELDTISMSASATADGSITLSSGDVILKKTGLWLIGGHWLNSAAAAGLMAIGISHTDNLAPSWICEFVNDASSGIVGMSCSGVVEQVSATATAELWFYSQNTTTAQAGAAGQILWGVWLGERP